MDLREGEYVQRVFHHHPTPFIANIFKVVFSFSPFFLLLFLLREGVSSRINIITHLVLFMIFLLVVIYMSLVYWLDKMVVTNMRIIFVDWRYLTVRQESEAMLDDIQEINTKENGFLAHFWIFDYGIFTLQTASSKVTLSFTGAPDPEGMRQYIYKIRKQ